MRPRSPKLELIKPHLKLPCEDSICWNGQLSHQKSGSQQRFWAPTPHMEDFKGISRPLKALEQRFITTVTNGIGALSQW